MILLANDPTTWPEALVYCAFLAFLAFMAFCVWVLFRD